MTEVLKSTKSLYKFRDSSSLKRTVNYVTESLSWLGPKVWKVLPDELKSCKSLD